MSIICVVQARMGSTRLPGKVLMDLGGEPMLAVMLGRLAAVSELAGIEDMAVIVATSDKAGDDPVAECANNRGVAVVRGDELDVLSRYSDALEQFPADHVVRLTADCPLIDSEIVAEVVHLHLSSGADYTSNTLLRTYPDGLDVEVITADALRQTIDTAEDPAEREHVTPYIYRNNSTFRLASLGSSKRLGHLRWTVDTAEDFAAVGNILEACAAEGLVTPSWLDILDALPAQQTQPLGNGLEPAVTGEVPERFTTLDDPSNPVLVYRRDGIVRAWLEVNIVDAHAEIHGNVSPEDLDDIGQYLEQYTASTPQILDYRFTPTDTAIGASS